MKYLLIVLAFVFVSCRAEVLVEQNIEKETLCQLIDYDGINYVTIYFCKDKIRNNCFYLTKYFGERIDMEMVQCPK